jgi:hypothetical protein
MEKTVVTILQKKERLIYLLKRFGWPHTARNIEEDCLTAKDIKHYQEILDYFNVSDYKELAELLQTYITNYPRYLKLKAIEELSHSCP